MERTLIIFKPDAIQRMLVGRILSRFEKKGLKVVGLKMIRIPRNLAERHYEVHREKPFYPGLIRFMTRSPVVVMALEGRNAVAVCRKMMGSTFGSTADPGSIRGDFGVSDSFNLIHGSDCAEAARRELELFFSPEELIDYDLVGWPWIYDLDEEA